jgi:ABC-type lipoprotein release transport system permease subunit
VNVLSVQYPTQIENYRSSGEAPDLLAGSLALGAVVALGLCLVASVRRRRRDLALLKALGFTRAQLAWTVAWQSTIAAAVGVIAGLPAGAALGRWLWDLFARSIYVVPDAPVPAVSLLLVAGAAFVLANAVAAFPGAYAARTPAALVLRAE